MNDTVTGQVEAQHVKNLNNDLVQLGDVALNASGVFHLSFSMFIAMLTTASFLICRLLVLHHVHRGLLAHPDLMQLGDVALNA
jgi:hypothetical protein